MVSGVATGILVSTSNHWKRISSIYASVSDHLCWDLTGHHWLSCGQSHINSDHVWRSERTSRSKG